MTAAAATAASARRSRRSTNTMPPASVVASLAAGLTTFPHGLFVDKDGNIWITDGRADKNKKIGHTVLEAFARTARC